MTIEESKNALTTLDVRIKNKLDEQSPSFERIVLLKTSWYADVMDSLESSARDYLVSLGIPSHVIVTEEVPGSFELPLAAIALAKSKTAPKLNFVVALGCIIKGETPHFDFVSQATVTGLMKAQMKIKKPIGMGVLTVDSIEQALARKNKGKEAAQAALEMFLMIQNHFKKTVKQSECQ